MTTPQHDISDLVLTRFDQTESRTYGILESVPGPCPLEKPVNFGFTIEEPWRNNERKISCVPTGRYPIRKYYSETLGWCIAIDDVPDRTLIRMHIGNILEETEGCPLLGLKRGKLEGKDAVLYSHVAMQRLLKRFSGQGFLTVKGGV